MYEGDKHCLFANLKWTIFRKYEIFHSIRWHVNFSCSEKKCPFEKT